MAQVYRDHGLLALVLIVLCIFGWKFVWRVWNTAMKSKDDEIERLVKERDKYHNLVFKNLRTSAVTDDDARTALKMINERKDGDDDRECDQ